jgi:WWE domain
LLFRFIESAGDLQASITALSGEALKLIAKCESMSKQQKLQASACAQWQCQSDEGWINYEQSVKNLLESAHAGSRSETAFRVNGIRYTADLHALVQKRQAKPYTERAIRRVGVADAAAEALRNSIRKRKQKVCDAVAVINRSGLATWECAADSGWMAYRADSRLALR